MNNDLCSICLNFLSIKRTIELPCHHLVHSGCYDEYKNHDRYSVLRCPLCRSLISNRAPYEMIAFTINFLIWGGSVVFPMLKVAEAIDLSRNESKIISAGYLIFFNVYAVSTLFVFLRLTVVRNPPADVQ